MHSYRDALSLFLTFVATQRRCKLTRFKLNDLTADWVKDFLKSLETERENLVLSRNQRLTALRFFFNYCASQSTQMWAEAEQVTKIPNKRAPPPRTFYLEREEIDALLGSLPQTGLVALRDRTLLMFLYNTGARAQEVADLQVVNLELKTGRVHLHGKGDKW